MLNLGNVLILGDSYSTFEGCIPEGYKSWYFSVPENDTDVTDKTKTWWYKLIENTDSELVRNESYSGTTVCNIRYGGEYCPKTSFIGRFDKLINDGFFKQNTVDTVLIFGGTNDSWANSPVGSAETEDFNAESLKCVLPAFRYLLKRVKQTLPDAETVFIMNTELKKEISDGFINLCNICGTEYVTLKEISKKSGHPDIKGMEQIYRQVYGFLEKQH